MSNQLDQEEKQAAEDRAKDAEEKIRDKKIGLEKL
jgi:hypothetical protein